MADKVARHLVAAGQIIDEDSELALQHAIAARRLASRIAVVREAVGLAAYAAGDWSTAIAELRTYHRMTGRHTHLAEIADSERALGRPERAIDLYRGADVEALDKSGAIELLIVAAGARGDLGQHDAAVAMLQVRELTGDEDAEWAARLRYAYADALLAADRREEAREWFSRAAAVDEDQLTDATERLLELDGITLEEDDDEDDDDEPRDQAGERDGERDGDDDLDEDDDEDDDEPRDQAGEQDDDDLDDEPRDQAGEQDDDLDEDEDDEDDVHEEARAALKAGEDEDDDLDELDEDDVSGEFDDEYEDDGDELEDDEPAGGTDDEDVAAIDVNTDPLRGAAPKDDEDKAADDEFVARADEKRPE
ncbi:hypothetical protein [Paractinoplanes rishiriensis]